MINSFLDSIIDVNAEQISGQDATFLYAESPTSPMHIATLTIVEDSLNFDDFKAIIASKIHLIPKFRKRLVNIPLNIDYPFWVDDPNFDLDLHLNRVKLPDPANWKTLRELTSSIFSESLDLRRPLWSIDFIEGLNNVSQVPKGSVAIVAKIHHVMIDGSSGVGIMGLLFDKNTDDKDKPIPKPKPFEPNTLPDDIQLLAKSAQGFIQNPLKLPKFVGETAFSFIKNKLDKQVKGSKLSVQKSYTTPKTIFNGTVAPKRTWGTAILSLERINNLRKIMGVTINDLIIAICAGAVRRYLAEKDKLPLQPLVANVPISIRNEGEKNELNNKISNMLIKIGTHIEDPIKRLEYIQFQTNLGKAKHKTVGAKSLAKMAEQVPFGLANIAAKIFSKYKLGEFITPPFNLTITNVPGPQHTLYLRGHKILGIFGLTPVLDGFGLIIAAFSYNGMVTITATSDAKTMPDADVFGKYIRESANELEKLILKKDTDKKPEKATILKSVDFFKNLKSFVNDNLEFENIKSTSLFEITSDNNVTHYTFTLNNNKTSYKKATAKKANCTIHIDDESLYKLGTKEVLIDELLIKEKIKIEGTTTKKNEFIKILQQFSNAN